MTEKRPVEPDLQPADERCALVQRLDDYRALALLALDGVRWEDASTRLLPATDMTIAGIVKHRWILVHMIDETARHVGHLDLLRDTLQANR